MEASVAASGDAGTQGDAGEAAADGGQGPDMAAMAEQLTSMQTSQEQLHQMMQQLATPADGADAEVDAGEEMDFSALFEDGGEEDTGQLAANLSSLMDKAAEQKAREMVGPVQEQVKEMQRNSEIQTLLGEFPELQDDAVAKTVFETATKYADAVGHPEHAAEPWFWRTVYLMGRAVDQANEEGGDQPHVAHLEGAGGSVPGGGGQGDLADRIMKAGGKPNGGLPF